MLDDSEILLIDGATGSELDRRGVDVSLPLWSARAIINAPDMLRRIHRDYLEAGADAVTASTFRTHRRTLAKTGMGDRARELTMKAVEIARRARDEVRPEALVLGSVAPLEDCYAPDLAPPFAACRIEHAEMIDALLEAGVDLLLIETMNNLTESRAAVEVARESSAGRWMISFCMQPGGEAGQLLSGASLSEFLPELGDAFAVGVNCTPAPETEAHVRLLRELLPACVHIAAYANIGRPDSERGWINTDAVNPDQYRKYAKSWLDAGATIIGGCCGTTPATIAALAGLKAKAHADRIR